MKYIALLRGINISGKNKISMSELKEQFRNLGYKEIYDNLIFIIPPTKYEILYLQF